MLQKGRSVLWPQTLNPDTDDQCLMQANGRQLGDIPTVTLEGLKQDLTTKLERVRRRSPAKKKHMLLTMVRVLARNCRSPLPSVRQVCRGLQQIVDDHLYIVERVDPWEYEKGRRWIKKFWTTARGKCRTAVSLWRRRVMGDVAPRDALVLEDRDLQVQDRGGEAANSDGEHEPLQDGQNALEEAQDQREPVEE